MEPRAVRTRAWSRLQFLGLLCALAAPLPARAASPLVGTSSAGDPMNTGHKYFTHYANGRYWVAYDTGAAGGSFNSSPDGVTWTSLGQIFPAVNPNSFANEWAMRYQGNTVIAAAFDGTDTRQYRSGTLNSDGTVSWSALSPAGPADATFNSLNVLINNGRPIMWRDDNTAGSGGAIWRGSAIASPTWTKTAANAPAMSVAGVSNGIFSGGALFPTGGANPDDLIVLRATTVTPFAAGNHRLLAMKWNAATDTYDASWYNVSTLGGTLTEDLTTEVQVNNDNTNQKRFAAVRDSSGNLHAVYVNRNNDMVHYRKAVGFNNSWTRVSAGINPPAENIDMVALTALPGNNLYLFYSKGDDRIYYRRFDGASWGADRLLLDVTATALRRVLAPPETAIDCTVGLAFVENPGASPWNVRFTLGVGDCSTLQTTTGAGTVTVTGPGSFAMRFNLASGGGIDQFFDLVEDSTAATDLAGGDTFHENLFIDEIVTGTGPFVYNFSSDGLGARLDVLEATLTRARVRQTAYFGDGATNSLADVFATGDYSLYPAGKMALSWRRWKTPTATVNYDTEELEVVTRYGAAPIDAWTSFHDAGALASLGPAASTFLLTKSDKAGARTDFLTIRADDWPVATQTVGGDTGGGSWQTLWRDNNTGTIADATFDWLIYFKPTNLGNTASPWTDPLVTTRASDYRVPDALSAIGPGAGWNENTGDADFFNEAEAAYTLDLNPSTGLAFTMNSAGVTRYSPFFKLRQWRSLAYPSTITVGGVAKTRGVDYLADVKPVARASFAQDLLWYSTLEGLGTLVTPDVGSSGSGLGGVYAPARFGNGLEFTLANSYVTFPVAAPNFDPARGALEFWFRPAYDSANGTEQNIAGFRTNPNNEWVLRKGADNNLYFIISAAGAVSTYTILAANYRWRARDWVHMRLEWDDSVACAPACVGQQRILVNGVEPPHTDATVNYNSASLALSPDFRVGSYRNGANESLGIYDEIYVYGGSAGTPTRLASGGLTSDTSEYLADASRNLSLSFATVDGARRGEYFYVGADAKFHGLNVSLAVAGASGGAPNLQWQYWNGTAWSDLEAVGGFADNTSNLTRGGTLSWTSDPTGWSVYSVKGGPDLYYVRAYLGSGTYGVTPPTEGVIKTDILLLQYCGDITALNTAFSFAAPLPTEVTLESFTAAAADGAVDLAWTTATELHNLGFHLYRSESAEGPFERITSSLIAGLGSSVVGRSYSFRDSALVNGRTYHYLLEDLETTGTTERHGPVSAIPEAAPSEPPCCGSPTDPPGASGTSYGEPSSVVLREVERSPRHVVLELRTGGFSASPAEGGHVRLHIPGFESASRPGEPHLPMRRAFVEAASGRRVHITSVVASDELRFPGLRPVPEGVPGIEVSEDGSVSPTEKSSLEGRAFRELFPNESARLVGTPFQRETKKAEILLFPLRWDGSGLVLSRRLLVRLEFSGTERGETSLGGSQGRGKVERSSSSRTGVLAQITVKERGLYRVDYEDVFPSGRSARGLLPSSLRLSRQGMAVAYHLSGEVFGPGSSLYFLTEGASLNPYADAVYELETNASGLAMEETTAFPLTSARVGEYLEKVRREENYYYQSGLLEARDPWLWTLAIHPGAYSVATVPFSTQWLSPTNTPGRLHIELQGGSDIPGVLDHHVVVRINGVFVGEAAWDGVTEQVLDFPVPGGAFVDGTNSLSLENVGDTGASSSMVFLNRFQVSYPRQLVTVQGTLEGRFEDTGPAEVQGAASSSFVLDTTETPRWLTGVPATASGLLLPVKAGRSYLVTSSVLRPTVKRLSPSTLRSPENQADYLLLGPAAFLSAAKPLLELRESQGLVTRAVSVEEVYEEFGHGEVSPQAIKEFLEYAYHSWKAPSVRYVLLLGDSTYDPKNYLGTGVTDRLPGFPVITSYIQTVSDPAYASVNGNDLLPDLAIGRLPAGSFDEAQGMVQKILSYENGGGTLDGRAVLVADNADLAGNFEASADDIAATVLASRNPQKIYYSVEGASTRTKILQAFDDGASLVSYIGHGSTTNWASEGFFKTSDVPSLFPQPQQPLVLTLNCLNGFYQFPAFNSLAEALIKAEGKGAIAAFSPTGLSVNDPAHVFHKAVLQQIVSGEHERLGDALLSAQEAYAQSGAFPELLSIYHLFGDPALRIR